MRRSDRLVPTDAVFARASDFVRARRARSSPDAEPLGWLRDVDGWVALARVVANTPTLDVRLTRGPAGRRIRTLMSASTWGVPRVRICAAVLPIPPDLPARPTGHRNRAMRSALRAADQAGLTVERVTGIDSRRAVMSELRSRGTRLRPWTADAATHAEQEWWVARDGGGAVTGLAIVLVDLRWASFLLLVGAPGTLQSTVRYVLHQAVAVRLSAAGVEHLAVLDASPLLADPGALHLQRVLGYRVVSLRRPRWLD